MVKQHKLFQVDSFTTEKLKGNPAGVVLEADQLTVAQMQGIARELNNSETAFILKAENSSNFCKIRYFTPATEVPFCGHATIASHHILATIHKMDTCQYFQESNIGIIPIEINRFDNHYHISLNQHQIEIGQVVEPQNTVEILDAIGLQKEDLFEGLPLQIISTGHSKVIIPISNKNRLNQLEPNFHQLSCISKSIKCNGFFVVALNENDSTTYGRMFAPIIGINEDPVTGNANGPLGVYLVHNNFVIPNNGLYEFEAIQGEAMGRTGKMKVQVSVDSNQKPIGIKITGTAVTIFETEFILP